MFNNKNFNVLSDGRYYDPRTKNWYKNLHFITTDYYIHRLVETWRLQTER
jgi:hypothetical protein